MRWRLLLVVLGVVLMVTGVYLSTQTIQINEGNQCTVDGGCRNVSAAVPTVAIGAAAVVGGLLLAFYGFRKPDEG